MEIIAKTLFKHGAETYQEGEKYTVEDGPGYYFVASGWATDTATLASLEPLAGEQTLDIQDINVGVTSPKVGV